VIVGSVDSAVDSAVERPVGGQPLLRVEGVSVRFGGLDVLTDVSLDVPAGSVVGVIGPNGAGKTTLFNTICGFVRIGRGALIFDGHELRRHRPHDLNRLGIARTLQGLGLFGQLSVLDNVLAGTTHQSRTRPIGAMLAAPWVDRDERRLREQAATVLESLGIAADADRVTGSLPYGVRKRVALARALVSEPRLLMLDEPAAGLSEAETTELADIVRSLRTPSNPTTVMLVEHHMDFVMGLCEHVVVLDFGHVIASGSPDAVRADPAVQRAYLGETVTAATDDETAATADPAGHNAHDADDADA
jgi:branched-chain amino acid transport system ATP-binding protein